MKQTINSQGKDYFRIRGCVVSQGQNDLSFPNPRAMPYWQQMSLTQLFFCLFVFKHSIESPVLRSGSRDWSPSTADELWEHSLPCL